MSEFSRCKVPKLTINKEEWSYKDDLKKVMDAKVNKKKKEEDAIEMENALLEGGAAWDIGVKEAAKKRKTAKGESRSKKRKMEKFGGWGEVTDLEPEWRVRD